MTEENKKPTEEDENKAEDPLNETKEEDSK